jgi:hypothetical protein
LENKKACQVYANAKRPEDLLDKVVTSDPESGKHIDVWDFAHHSLLRDFQQIEPIQPGELGVCVMSGVYGIDFTDDVTHEERTLLGIRVD